MKHFYIFTSLHFRVGVSLKVIDSSQLSEGLFQEGKADLQALVPSSSQQRKIICLYLDFFEQPCQLLLQCHFFSCTTITVCEAV